MFSVRLTRDAERFYAAADRPLARKLARCFERLAIDPRRHPNITALKGELADCYRYRVVYTIDNARQIVNVLTIGHRRGGWHALTAKRGEQVGQTVGISAPASAGVRITANLLTRRWRVVRTWHPARA